MPQPPDDWRKQAACRHHDPELFFPPEKGGDPRIWDAPRAVCTPCPVKEACLRAALDADEDHGMFGGLDPFERRRIQARRKRQRRPERLLVHGTPAGYQRHRRDREPACPSCHEAMLQASRRAYARKVAG